MLDGTEALSYHSRKGKCHVVTMKEIMEAAASLSVEERAMVVDSILRSLSPGDPDTDSKWAEAAQRRLGEVKR